MIMMMMIIIMIIIIIIIIGVVVVFGMIFIYRHRANSRSMINIITDIIMITI